VRRQAKMTRLACTTCLLQVRLECCCTNVAQQDPTVSSQSKMPPAWIPPSCEFPLHETCALERSGRLIFDRKDAAAAARGYGEVFPGTYVDDTGPSTACARSAIGSLLLSTVSRVQDNNCLLTTKCKRSTRACPTICWPRGNR
jgi:hypothetical protein